MNVSIMYMLFLILPIEIYRITKIRITSPAISYINNISSYTLSVLGSNSFGYIESNLVDDN